MGDTDIEADTIEANVEVQELHDRSLEDTFAGIMATRLRIERRPSTISKGPRENFNGGYDKAIRATYDFLKDCTTMSNHDIVEGLRRYLED